MPAETEPLLVLTTLPPVLVKPVDEEEPPLVKVDPLLPLTKLLELPVLPELLLNPVLLPELLLNPVLLPVLLLKPVAVLPELMTPAEGIP